MNAETKMGLTRYRPWRAPVARGRAGAAVLGLVVVAAVAVMLFSGLRARWDARAELDRDAREANVPTVAVIKPKAGAEATELLLPGAVQALREAPVYARTAGYLKSWNVEIGSRVKAGQVLAVIDTPEVDQQLQQARADLAAAEAAWRLAQTTAARYNALLASEAVSRQEVDERRSDVDVRKAALDAARSNVARLMRLQSFEQVRAPFDGVVTARNTDVGTLIDPGAGTGTGRELFHVAASERMRIFVNVPQVYAREVVPGVPVELTLNEYPGRRFKAAVVRTSGAFDAAAHTLLAEIDVDNGTGELLPGSYVEAHLKLKRAQRGFVVPINTLLFRAEGTQVAVVRGDQAVLVKVVVGEDFGTELSLVSGLKGDEQVIVNPADSLASGARVRVVRDKPAAPAAEPGKAAAAKSGA